MKATHNKSCKLTTSVTNIDMTGVTIEHESCCPTLDYLNLNLVRTSFYVGISRAASVFGFWWHMGFLHHGNIHPESYVAGQVYHSHLPANITYLPTFGIQKSGLIFTILAERVLKARAASARAFSRGVRGHVPPENF